MAMDKLTEAFICAYRVYHAFIVNFCLILENIMLPKHFMVCSDGSLHDMRKGVNAPATRFPYQYAYTKPKNSLELRATIRQGYIEWGGYEIVGICSDGGILCNKCCHKNYYLLAYSRKYNIKDGWHVVGFETTATFEDGECCSHCNKWLDAYNEQVTFDDEENEQ